VAEKIRPPKPCSIDSTLSGFSFRLLSFDIELSLGGTFRLKVEALKTPLGTAWIPINGHCCPLEEQQCLRFCKN
jgi:hypothetical protein